MILSYHTENDFGTQYTLYIIKGGKMCVTSWHQLACCYRVVLKAGTEWNGTEPIGTRA